MIRDITIGQYYPVESVVHRLDPRTKLFGTLIYIISLFFADNLLCYAVATVFLAMRSAPHAYHLNLSCGDSRRSCSCYLSVSALTCF